MTFFFSSRKALCTIAPLVLSCIPAFLLPASSGILEWKLTDAQRLRLSSFPAVSSRSHSTEAVGSLEAGKHFPQQSLRRSLSLCWSWLNQPFGQTLQPPADLPLPIVSPLSKIRLLQRVLLCRCLHTAVSSFGPVFSYLWQGQNSFSLGKQKSEWVMIFPHRHHSYRVGFSIECIEAVVISSFLTK